MRILMLAQSYLPVLGGEERMVQDLSRELLSRGHHVGVATLTPQSADGPDGVTVHRLRASGQRIPRSTEDVEPIRTHAVPFPDPETIIDLRRVISQERPDVVHAHNWIAHSYLPLHTRRSPPLVVTPHDYGLVCATKRLFYDKAVCDGPGPRKCVACSGRQFGTAAGALIATSNAAMRPWLLRATDMFLPVSDAVLRGSNLTGHPRVRVIPNLVRPLPARPDPADARLRRLPEEPFVLFFGDASVDKGAHHLVTVYRSLESAPPLVLVGRPISSGLDGIPGVVQMGPLPHELAIEAVRRSLFTVAPSLWAEPFGLVALETGAAGKAIIASDIGGLRDVVLHERTGLLVTPGDRDALTAALRRLIADSGLRERLGSAAAEHIARTYAPGAIVPEFEAAYTAVIDSARVRRAGVGGRAS